jgi:NADH dehydrogenase [ubiquinone] 1 alpha subcomplex assembly factor 6
MLLLSANRCKQLGSVLRNTARSFSAKPQSSRNNEQSKKDFEYCVDLVQNRDRESYLCGLLMPSFSRQSYFAIRALNVELASIKDGSVSRKVGGAQFDESGGSMALRIRIQWWRQALNQIYGDSPVSTDETASQDFLASMAHSSWKNPVVRVLDQAVHESNLTRRFLERLLEAREADLDIRQEESMDDAILYSESTFSSLLYLSLETTNVSKGLHPCWMN